MVKRLEDGGELRPAYALDKATQHPRTGKIVGVKEFFDWIPFVHFGIYKLEL